MHILIADSRVPQADQCQPAVRQDPAHHQDLHIQEDLEEEVFMVAEDTVADIAKIKNLGFLFNWF
jgi:hypothetical protein